MKLKALLVTAGFSATVLGLASTEAPKSLDKTEDPKLPSIIWPLPGVSVSSIGPLPSHLCTPDPSTNISTTAISIKAKKSTASRVFPAFTRLGELVCYHEYCFTYLDNGHVYHFFDVNVGHNIGRIHNHDPLCRIVESSPTTMPIPASHTVRIRHRRRRQRQRQGPSSQLELLSHVTKPSMPKARRHAQRVAMRLPTTRRSVSRANDNDEDFVYGYNPRSLRDLEATGKASERGRVQGD
ncbi:hypothetical protein CC78DRAFT_616267 [Lojkania enalia]|uniref:Uncharacterized protein n=1 Tax=Lojkania enalia TaxID=147567 RepID=A0A9P4KBY8_9PLEO|nr:hypothetical protein CC78DRAFT_616267 [Didymosphaeria enalia]